MFRSFVVTALATLGSLGSCQPQYRVEALGVLADYQSSWAYGINDLGDAVGASFRPDDVYGDLTPTLWTGGSTVALPNIDNQRAGVAVDLNDSGVATGSTMYYHAQSTARPAQWRDGEFSYLPGIQGFNSLIPRAINSSGTSVGAACLINDESCWRFGAAVWRNGVADLFPVEYEWLTWANEVNDSEVIVGSDNSRPVYWHDDEEVFMPLLAGHANGEARAINNVGGIAGTSYLGTEWNAVLWRDNEVIAIPNGPTGAIPYSEAINDSFQIVGALRQYSNERAFLWDDGTTYDLNDLAVSGSEGWLLQSATDVNSSGTIVGYGLHLGQTRAFMATPVPEPGSLAVLALGAVTMLRRKPGRTTNT